MEKPTLPKGTRDFGPAQMARRQFIFNNIRTVFQKYGFQPLETPAMENLSTLTGKYGEEGDQLLFKVLDSGDFLKPVKEKLSNPVEQNIAIIQEWSDLIDYCSDYLKEIMEACVDKEYTDFNKVEQVKEAVKQISFSQYNPEVSAFYREKINEFFDIEKEYIATSIIEHLIYTGISRNKIQESFHYYKSRTLNRVLLGKFIKYLTQLGFKDISHQFISKEISEKGLRYDLTVPFARYVVMNRGEISFPFKRYQMQPVWRADRPQRGRYREFYQCDADVVGTDSLICEAEIILMIKEVFKALGIGDYTIKVNHRGILSGLAELTGTTNETALFVAIDKLDKIGEEKVREELIGKGFSNENLDTVFEILNFKGTTVDKMKLLTERFTSSSQGAKGLADFGAVLQLLTDYGVNDEHVEFDIALARGLSYYTGCIFEVKINNVAIGSVSGGGRYDNLTQAFGAKERLSGVGISFGIDRIYDAMEDLEKSSNKKLFPDASTLSSKVLICHFDEESKRYGLKVLNTLRNSGIASEIYPDTVKINKQLDYANKKSIPYTIVIGSDEVKSGVLSLKDMRAGEQSKLSVEDILKKLAVGTEQ